MKHAVHYGLFLLALFAFFHPTEGYVSQIHHNPVDFQHVSSRVYHIVKVRDLAQEETVREVVFPKSTSKQNSETIYTEKASLYEVEAVLNSDCIHVGQTIKVMSTPAYSEAMMRRYHEDGLMVSPIVNQYRPTNAPQSGDSLWLLLGDASSGKNAPYLLIGKEGLASEAMLRQAVTDNAIAGRPWPAPPARQ